MHPKQLASEMRSFADLIDAGAHLPELAEGMTVSQAVTYAQRTGCEYGSVVVDVAFNREKVTKVEWRVYDGHQFHKSTSLAEAIRAAFDPVQPTAEAVDQAVS